MRTAVLVVVLAGCGPKVLVPSAPSVYREPLSDDGEAFYPARAGEPFEVRTLWHGVCESDRIAIGVSAEREMSCHEVGFEAWATCAGVPCQVTRIPDDSSPRFEVVAHAPGMLELTVTFEPRRPAGPRRVLRERVTVVP
jgi:hypothetical protein